MTRIFFICLFIVSPLFYTVDCQTTSDKCTGAGDIVCIDCKTQGLCSGGSGSEVTTTACMSDEICDESLNPGVGCFAGLLLESVCGCTNAEVCNFDPNTNDAIVDCTDTNNPVYFTCDAPDLTSSCTCDMSTASTTFSSLTGEPTISTTTTTVSSLTDEPTISSTTTTVSSVTDEPTIITADTTVSSDMTDEPTITTTTSTTTTTTTTTLPTTTENPCAFCGYVNDPTGCRKYFKCVNGDLVPQTCPGITCFNPVTCQCELVFQEDNVNI